MLKLFSCCLGLLVLKTQGQPFHDPTRPQQNIICKKAKLSDYNKKIECSYAEDYLAFESSSTNLLNITITSDDFKDLAEKRDNLIRSQRNYRVDSDLRKKSQSDLKAMMDTEEYKDLHRYWSSNWPPQDKMSRVWMKKVRKQWTRVFHDLYEMKEDHSDYKKIQAFFHRGLKGKIYWQYSNQDYKKFDEEYGKLLQYRKSFIRTPWGQGLKQRAEKLRKTPQFKALEQDWMTETKQKPHVQFTKDWEAFMDAMLDDFKFEDKPDGFEDGPFVKQVFKFVGFLDEILHGKIQGPIDYILEDDQ